MSRIMVRYKVKPDLGETNAELVRAVDADLLTGPFPEDYHDARPTAVIVDQEPELDALPVTPTALQRTCVRRLRVDRRRAD